MKVGEKMDFGRLATIFQICSMDAEILSWEKKSALDHRKLYLFKVKDFIVWPTFVLSLLSLLEFANALKQQHKYIIKQNQSPPPEKSKITEKLSRELNHVRIAAGKRIQACLQSDLLSGLPWISRGGLASSTFRQCFWQELLWIAEYFSTPESNFQNKNNL